MLDISINLISAISFAIFLSKVSQNSSYCFYLFCMVVFKTRFLVEVNPPTLFSLKGFLNTCAEKGFFSARSCLQGQNVEYFHEKETNFDNLS